jgi:ABC-type transport system involved in multi-copper enzyme maturation permease subunit
MLFAFAIERDPLSLANLPQWVVDFLQNGGGIAMLGLTIWVLAYLVRRLTARSPEAAASVFDPFGGFLRLDAPGGAPAAGALDRGLAHAAPLLRRVFVIAFVAAAVIYAALGALRLPELLRWVSARAAGENYNLGQLRPAEQQLLDIGLTVAGACALFAVLLPFAVDLLRLRGRRVWALAKLTILEVIRRRVLWVFLALALVFLFGTWFIDSKPENQLRSYVEVVYLAMAVLVLLTGTLLASFSLPADIKSQTIHTIVTKPVERFEIFLGRFLGYTAVLSVALALMTGFSLLYIRRGVDPDAAAESEKARVPVYGDELKFEGTRNPNGENVGNEWEYRGYISGRMAGETKLQYAVWSFGRLPADLAHRDQPVRCEFTFAVYRTTIGEINKGVFCEFAAESWLWDPALRGEYEAERKRLLDAQKSSASPLSDLAVAEQLAEKYGIYELPSKEVTNYHTQWFEIPAGLFHNHLRGRDELRPRLEELRGKQERRQLSAADARLLDRLERDARGEARPPLVVRVRCISRTQFVGMARYDLYFLDREGSFFANFFKGAAGIWFWTELLLIVALACSTYLSGVVTWISVIFLFGVGMFRDFVITLAKGQNEGGGPGESLVRLFGRSNAILPLDPGAGSTFAKGSDVVYQWVLSRCFYVIPDVWSCDFSGFVANGFNVSGDTLLAALVYLAGYLLLWMVLGYYLIKSREIAIPT